MCRRLRGLSTAHRQLLVANRYEAARAEIVGELIRRSESHRSRKPPAMLSWSRLAVEVAEGTRRGRVPTAAECDLLAQAWACLGNGFRVVGNLRESDKAWSTAHCHLARGTGNDLVVAKLSWLLSLLRRRQRRYDSARDLAERSVAGFERAGEPHHAAISLMSLAITLHEAGNIPGAALATSRALERFEPGRDPALVVAAANNLVFYMLQLGRVGDATDCFEAVKRAHGGDPPPSEALRVSWLEAKLAHATDQRVKAQAVLSGVRRGFIELGLPYDAALAGLELAVLHAEAGRPADVERLATEMYPTFISSDLPAPALATLMLFVKAVDARAAEPARLRELLSTLETQRYSDAD